MSAQPIPFAIPSSRGLRVDLGVLGMPPFRGEIKVG